MAAAIIMPIASGLAGTAAVTAVHTAIAGALVGAATGALVSAVTGGDIMKGALFGAIGGAVGGALMGPAAAAAGPTTAGTLGSMGVPAADAAAMSAVGGATPIATPAGVGATQIYTSSAEIPATVQAAPTGIMDKIKSVMQTKEGTLSGTGQMALEAVKGGAKAFMQGEDETGRITAMKLEMEEEKRQTAQTPGRISIPTATIKSQKAITPKMQYETELSELFRIAQGQAPSVMAPRVAAPKIMAPKIVRETGALA